MKLDIVRAWKDEHYRQDLSADQRNAMPANPAGELSEAEMEMVFGGGGGLGSGGGGAPVVTPAAPSVHYTSHFNRQTHVVGATTTSAASERHCHSYVVAICDANVFSNDVIVLLLAQNVLNIGSPRTENCGFAG